MSNKTPILLFGATGYIGGAVLAHLLLRDDIKAADITVYVRNTDKATILEQKFGINTVVGSNQEHAKVTAAAEGAHVVFQVADAADVAFNEAVLSGMKNRYTKTGVKPNLIYTSGTGVLADNARGEYASETIYDDLDVEQLKSIPSTAVLRNVELLVIAADTEGYVRGHIVAPSTVWGIAKHVLAEAGVSNRQSLAIPMQIRAALGRKQAGVVGKGRAYWPNVHIDDCADLYTVLLDSIIDYPEKTGHGWEGIYFAANGEHTWLELGQACGEALVALGIASDPTPTPFTLEDFRTYFSIGGFGGEFIGWMYGTNSRCRANRARSIGWKPQYTKDDMLKSIRPEMELMRAQ